MRTLAEFNKLWIVYCEQRFLIITSNEHIIFNISRQQETISGNRLHSISLQ
jgi:hypothetical protein